MSLHEVGRIAGELLQFGASLADVPGHHIERGQLIAHRRVAGADAQRPFEGTSRLVVLLILFKEHADLQVGNEIVRIGFQFLAERAGCRGHIARAHQPQPVVGVDIGELRIELGGPFQVRQGLGKILRVHLRGAQQQPRLGRFAFAQDAVHQYLAARRLVVADQSRAQQVDERLVVGRLLFQRREQLDYLFVLTQPQVAIGQQKDHLPV